MDNIIFWLAYTGYISISSVLAYPLLKWKGQHPKTISAAREMIFFNFIFLGILPLLPFLMKHPPSKPPQRADGDYYERGKIWIWNK